MKTLLIVWHSRTGGARAMAEAAAAGAEEEPLTRTRLLAAEQATGADVVDADGYVFAMPENLAALSGPMKDFFDRAYYPALDRIAGRPYALLVCAGTDGTNAVRRRRTPFWRRRRSRRICWRAAATSAPLWHPVWPPGFSDSSHALPSHAFRVTGQ